MQEQADIHRMIKLLDHGEIKLVDYMGGDNSIVKSARISHDNIDLAGADKERDDKLINYLYAHGHNTPSESTVFTFYVKLPIFVARQWMRHRTQSYNEVSARYTELPAEFYIPEGDNIGKQHSTNKQMRDHETRTEEEIKYIRDLMIKQNTESFKAYHFLLNSGVPRELARSVLPVSTYTKMFTTVNLHNLFGFLWERMHDHAQYEIRVYANAMFDLVQPVVPVAADAFRLKMIEASRIPTGP